MSEYQYYEFQAIDLPLTKTEQEELRACSHPRPDQFPAFHE